MKDFRPGMDWAEHVATFLGGREKAAATDHAEQLALSQCKQAAGGKLWCATCHDPHEAKPAGNDSCTACHPKAHKGEKRDCASCHMPKAATQEGEHVAYTNHSIPRDGKPRQAAAWRSYPGTTASERDWALAFGERAGLEKAARDNDAPVLAALAQVYDRAGKQREAVELYERLRNLDADHPALANLAIYRVQQGKSAEAILLWERVLARHPAQAAPAMNLALYYAQQGRAGDAQRTLERLLRFQPDLAAARKFLATLREER
jgi:tetratricopeptide (TPR) repeat protein